MSALARYFVWQVLIGKILSMSLPNFRVAGHLQTLPRMKSKLINSQIQIVGDQWPIFLYANYVYDPEDPWNGLLHSGLLVLVSLFTVVRLTFCSLPVICVGLQAYIYFTKFS